MVMASSDVLRQRESAGGEWILETEQWLPSPLARVFPFFADPRNLEEITPPFLHFAVLRSSDREVRRGTLIDYRLRLRGLPIRWRTRIDEWQPPHRFVDLQLKGPYGLWHHTHEFEERDGGTLVRDRVRYRLPFGALGNLVAGGWVRNDVASIFRFRQEKMRAIFAAAAAVPAAPGVDQTTYVTPRPPHDARV
jgi:ligand-binding SRPBCC domain-containing protein